jgi:hypothetical protein
VFILRPSLALPASSSSSSLLSPCRGCWNLDDSDLKAIAHYCPALTHVNLDYCAFSETALAGFVAARGAKLRELSLWWTVRTQPRLHPQF